MVPGDLPGTLRDLTAGYALGLVDGLLSFKQIESMMTADPVHSWFPAYPRIAARGVPDCPDQLRSGQLPRAASPVPDLETPGMFPDLVFRC